MAGIGFQLRRLTAPRTFSGLLGAYASAAAISAGPWIISIIALMVLTWLLHLSLPADQISLFNTSVTHVYAFALILTGPLQIVLARYTADRISMKQEDRIFASFKGGVALAAVLSAVLGGVFFFRFVHAPVMFSAFAAGLLVHVSCIFIASVYLSALRKYYGIVFAFVIGYGSGIMAAWQLSRRFGVEGAMAGLLLGHLVLFVFLAISIRAELKSGAGSAFAFMRSLVKFPDLMLCGLFYNLGIWIDKFLFWWLSESRVQVSGALFSAPDYDLAIYLSLLSIAPGMAVFILQVETDFSEKFHEYFDTVNEGGTMSEVISAKHRLILSLRDGFNRLLKVQGVATALLVIYANDLTAWFNVSHVQTGIFRITLFGTFLLVLFLAMLTVLFYFNDRRGALLCAFVFLLANGLLSAATIVQNEAWYGFGFVVAAGLALFIAAARVNSRLDHLEYHTFRIQPA
jgi:polysaccharide biosynthesis protein PelG